ncbi:hypothetical protein HS088_TW08G00738 [Tripterygium wilfordii]|uniref:Adenine nucleotide alpha hydrolases-like superfamily protein n=1 Tax=Tripterygium wilfordii TaxID=458696 RepID=A0A7J7DCR2_TRIWF|nr:hypothetical protein HS088_TW08G00738 [Tripterygium wilfordii]
MATTTEKQVMVVGIDDSEHSTYALVWTLDHFFTPLGSNSPFKLVIVHAKPSPASAVGLAGPAFQFASICKCWRHVVTTFRDKRPTSDLKSSSR